MFKYTETKKTNNRFKFWAYLFTIVGVLQLILFLYILFLATTAMNSEKYSAAGAAMGIVLATLPLLFLASVNFFGLPFYIKATKPKGFKLIPVCISWFMSVFIGGYTIWFINTL
jgi:hypothetical protein